MRKTIARFFTWPFDDDMAIVDTVRRELRIVNASAANVWRLVEAGIACPDELCQIISDHYGIARTVIEADIRQCLGSWQALGWIGDAACPVLDTIAPAVPPFGPLNFPDAGEQAPTHPVVSHHFRLPSAAAVTLHISRDGQPRFREIADRLQQILSGLDPAGPPDRADQPPEDGLALLDGGDRYWLRTDGVWLWTTDVAEIMSRVQMQLLASGYAGLPRLVTMHAAVVGRGGGCLLLPGISGAGKSTLTGWLASHGWSYGGDDMTGLMAAPAASGLLALPFTTALSVKTGSWPLLAPFYPDLMNRPRVPCAGRDARYVPLPAPRRIAWDETARRIRALVFPRYQAGADTRLVSLSLRDTVQRLSESGFTTGDHLDADMLHQFFTLLEALPRRELVYSRLEEAQARLEQLVTEEA